MIFCRLESGSSRASTTSSMWTTSPRPGLMSPGWGRCSIRSCSSARLAIQAFVPWERSFSASASTRSSDRWPWMSRWEDCSCLECEMRWTWQTQPIRSSISPLWPSPCENNCWQSMARRPFRMRLRNWRMKGREIWTKSGPFNSELKASKLVTRKSVQSIKKSALRRSNSSSSNKVTSRISSKKLMNNDQTY